MKVMRTNDKDEFILVLTKDEMAGLTATAMDSDTLVSKIMNDKGFSNTSLDDLRLRHVLDMRVQNLCSDLFEQVIRRPNDS